MNEWRKIFENKIISFFHSFANFFILNRFYWLIVRMMMVSWKKHCINFTLFLCLKGPLMMFFMKKQILSNLHFLEFSQWFFLFVHEWCQWRVMKLDNCDDVHSLFLFSLILLQCLLIFFFSFYQVFSWSSLTF